MVCPIPFCNTIDLPVILIAMQNITRPAYADFAILRSIIDTSIKSGQNVVNALSLIDKLGTE